MAIQWIALCVAAALVCALLRAQRPELATAVSLAAGVAVTVMLASAWSAEAPRLESLWNTFRGADSDIRSAVLRGAGVAILSDLAAQICRDAGETALAGRVTLIARVSILALCVPLLSELVESLGQFAP